MFYLIGVEQGSKTKPLNEEQDGENESNRLHQSGEEANAS